MKKHLPTTAVSWLLVFAAACLLAGCSQTPEKILAKYAAATNPSGIAKPRSVLMKAKLSQQNESSTVTAASLMKASAPAVRLHSISIYCEQPDKIFLDGMAALVGPDRNGLGERKIADVTVKRSFDGQSGWESTASPQNPAAGGTRELQFFEIDKLKSTASGAFAMNAADNLTRTKYIGEQPVEYHDPSTGALVKKNTHVVEAFSGGKKQSLFFDVNDGLLVKVEETNLLSNNKLKSIMMDYKQFGSVRLPSRVLMIPEGKGEESMLLTIEDLQFDAPQPAGAFVKPT